MFLYTVKPSLYTFENSPPVNVFAMTRKKESGFWVMFGKNIFSVGGPTAPAAGVLAWGWASFWNLTRFDLTCLGVEYKVSGLRLRIKVFLIFSVFCGASLPL